MNDTSIIYPALFLLIATILGLFLPSPLYFALSWQAAKQGLYLALGLAVVSIYLFISAPEDWGITLAAASEGVFMLTLWLSAPGRYERKRHSPYPQVLRELSDYEIDWDTFDRARIDW